MLHRRLAAAALVALGLVACQPAAAGLSDADRAKIEASIDAYVKTTLAADWDGWAANITDDEVMLPPNGPPVVGKAASVAFVKAYPKITQFTAPADEIVGAGGVAWARGTFRLSATLPNGQAVPDSGHYMVAFTRMPDGSWKQSRQIWHSDAPLPATPAPTPRRGR